MSEDTLTRIEKKLSEIWEAIDEIRANVNRIEVKQTAKIARLEVLAASNKFLVGLVIAQLLGWATWMMKK